MSAFDYHIKHAGTVYHVLPRGNGYAIVKGADEHGKGWLRPFASMAHVKAWLDYHCPGYEMLEHQTGESDAKPAHTRSKQAKTLEHTPTKAPTLFGGRKDS